MSMHFRDHQLKARTYFSINRNISVFATIIMGICGPLYEFLPIICKTLGPVTVVRGRRVIILLDAKVGIECDDDGADDIMY